MTEADFDKAIAEELHRIAPDIDAADIDRDADIREECDIDSMDFLNLITALSKRYGIAIPESDYASLFTYTGAIAYLAKKTG